MLYGDKFQDLGAATEKVLNLFALDGLLTKQAKAFAKRNTHGDTVDGHQTLAASQRVHLLQVFDEQGISLAQGGEGGVDDAGSLAGNIFIVPG